MSTLEKWVHQIFIPADQDPVELDPIEEVNNLLIAFHVDGEALLLLGFADF